MGIDQVIVAGIVIIIVITICLVFFDFLMPLYAKQQFENLCRTYVLIAESENGLSTEKSNRLKEKILTLGVEDVVITAQNINEVKRNETIEIKVEGQYVVGGITGLFKRENKTMSFKFESEVYARRVVN
jgi:hypothetical protein